MLQNQKQCFLFFRCQNNDIRVDTNMLKTYKSSLQLNSYKLDTQGFEQRLKIATQENQDLKASIHNLKLKENQLYEQLKITKQQNNTLRIKLRNQSQQQQSQCRNCIRFSQNLQRLSQQMIRERQKTNQFKEMYENEIQNKKDASMYYQKKLQTLLKDKDILIKKYQDKIKIIYNQNSLQSLQSIQSQPNFNSATSIDRQISPKKEFINDSINTQETQQQKSLRKFPPSPQRINQTKTATQSQKALPVRKPTEQTLDCLLIPFLERLQKMNLSLSQLRYIQQIDRFSQSGLIPKNRYIKLMREFPFQCEDQDSIESSFQFIVTALRDQSLEETGTNIVNYLINRMKYLQQ